MQLIAYVSYIFAVKCPQIKTSQRHYCGHAGAYILSSVRKKSTMFKMKMPLKFTMSFQYNYVSNVSSW